MKILTLSLVLLLSVPATQFAMEGAEVTPASSEEKEARAHAIADEATTKAREDQPQFQEQAPPTHPSTRANLPTDDSKTTTNNLQSRMRATAALGEGNLLINLLSSLAEDPFSELKGTIKATDTLLNRVLAQYHALAKDNDLQTPEALDAFKKEKEEFNNAGDVTYEFLARHFQSKSIRNLFMQHPATTRLSVKVALNMKSLATEDNTKLALAQDVAALYKGLEFLQSRVKKSHSSSSSGSSSDSE